MMRKRYTVLNYIIGGYEKVHEIGEKDPECEYLLVTDDQQLTSKTWMVIYDPTLTSADAFARCAAIRYNLFKYATTDICVALDASIQVNKSLKSLVDFFEDGRYDISLMPHPRHDVFLPEYEDWVNVRNYPPSQQEKFFTMLRQANYDLSYRSLFQLCYRIVRRGRTNDCIDQLMLAFLRHLGDGECIERLDQTVYSYVLNVWFNDLRVLPVSEQIVRSDHMTWYFHGGDVPNLNASYDIARPDRHFVFNRLETCVYLMPDGVRSAGPAHDAGTVPREEMFDTSLKLACQREEMNQLRQEAESLRREAEALRREAEASRRECADLQSSTCWRMTAPVRKVLDLLKSLKCRVKTPMLLPAPETNEKPLHERLLPGDAVLDPCPDEALSVVEDRISVVIPTFQAGEGFKELLHLLSAQRKVKDLEIIVVDSGSADGTVEAARVAGAVVMQIPHEQFNHATTRNLAVEKATGKYVIMMTQDALPTDDLWAVRLLRPVVLGKASAVVCRQAPRPGCTLFGRYQIQGLNWLLAYETDRIVAWPDAVDYLTLRRHAQLNDVACAIERELLQKFRYRYGYGEDLDLGLRLLRTGHRIAKLATVSVIHSHDRPAFYDFRRTLVDIPNLKRIMPTAPVERVDRDLVIARILTAHDVLVALAAELKTVSRPGNWKEALVLVSQRGQSILESHAQRNTQGGNSVRLSDEDLESTVEKLRTEAEKTPVDATLAESVLSVVRDELPRMLSETGWDKNPVDPSAIADFLERSFAVRMGLAIASYAFWHRQDEDVLTQICGDLAHGI